MDDDSSPATKGDLKNHPTKSDTAHFATKDDLKNLATKDDLKNFATKDDVRLLRDDFQRAFVEFTRSMNEKFTKVHDDIDLVLTVLSNTDKRNKEEFKDHEKRIVRLEKIVL